MSEEIKEATPPVLEKAYCGVSHQELSLTPNQVKLYYCWRKYKGFTIRGRRPDYSQIKDESVEDYHKRVYCEERMSDYLYLKFTVKMILSRHGYLSDNEIWTWVENTGGHNVLISTHGRVYRVMYYSAKRGYSPVDKAGNVRGVFELHPDKRQLGFSVTSPRPVEGFCPAGGYGGYKATFYLCKLMKEYFTKEQIAKCMGQDAADFICYEGRRPSRFKTYMTIQSVETGEVMKFNSKTEMGKHFGVTKEAIVMAVKRGKEGKIRIKRKEYILIEDYKREGKNVNAQPGHNKKRKKRMEAMRRKEHKKMVTRVCNDFKKDNRKLWKGMLHNKEMREKAEKLLGSYAPYDVIRREFQKVDKYDWSFVKYCVDESYKKQNLIDYYSAGQGLVISDEEWCNRLADLVMENKMYEDECKYNDERAAYWRKIYGRKAWREKRLKAQQKNAHAADILI